jgi:hypothetical protein
MASVSDVVKEMGVKVDPKLLKGLRLSGFEDSNTRRLAVANHLMRKSNVASLKPLLPLLLNLKGQPYSLDDYFPFEPYFRTRMARKSVLKTGRQVSKSTSLASRGVVQSNCLPYFSTLYITPLFEMIRRFSQNYVRPFIEQSPVANVFTGTNTSGSVLQKSFRNNSQMIFSFAFLDAERTRGISADQTCYDEVQDLDKDFIPIIRETMSGSKYGGLESYAGTPKTLENTLEVLWRDSSMAEWVIKCQRCSYFNVPAMTHDLDKMLGPRRDDITEDKPAVICAKCRRPIHPKEHGRWVHAHPEKRWTFAGYHVPQIIMPMHYGDPEKWDILLGKREGRGNTPVNVFYNEVCGESFDTGSKLVTLTDLMKASCLPWKNEVEVAQKQLGEYILRVLAVDWGGGGEKGVSFTSYAVMGMMPTGKVDVLYGFRSLTPHDHPREARLALAMIERFKCTLLAHDYTGAGALRETFINQAGFPFKRIIACQMQRAAAGGIITPKPPTERHPRYYYLVDKSRTLQLTCNQIKSGWLRFFQDDYIDAENPGLIRDFLALLEEKVDSRLGKDIYTIVRDPALSDDFAQAVNLGLITLYQATGNWPNLAEVDKMAVDKNIMDALSPSNPDWDA